MPLKIDDHIYSVMATGYTVMPNQIGSSDLDDLRECVDRAFEAVRRVQAAGRADSVFNYPSVQCMYVWGDACVGLLEHETIHALTEGLMREYRLWAYNLLDRAPRPDNYTPPVKDPFHEMGMHQDFSLPFHGSPRPFYLWHFVCLDDVTPENGATWVIPGSHRAPEITMSRHGDYRHFSGGSAIQLCARAGDIIALNPCCYHDPGVNYSDSGRRRYLAVQMCYITLPSLYDHWVIAGPKLQSAASPRLRMLLGAEVKPAYAHAQAAYVLPEGWETSGNPYCEGINTMGLVPAAQLLREQQARFTTS